MTKLFHGIDKSSGTASIEADDELRPPDLRSLALMRRLRERRLQRKASGAAPEPRQAPDVAFARATEGTPAEVPFRGEMEQAFGEDFSTVKAHIAQPEPMSAIGARAAAAGEHVAFA